MADDLAHKGGTGSFDPSKTRLFHSPGPQGQASEKPRKRPPPLPAARPDWHDKTRVLPIERLLPELAKHHTELISRPRTAPKPVRLVRLVSKQRACSWAVCLVLWVSVAAASGMPSPATPTRPAGAADTPGAITIQTTVPAGERRRTPSALSQPSASKRTDQIQAGAVMQPLAEHQLATSMQPSAPNQVAAGASAQRLAAANPVGASSPVQPSATRRLAASPSTRPANTASQPRVSPRAAVEALAAGDTLAASHLYAALAEQNPDNLAYARAARILKQRAHNPGATP